MSINHVTVSGNLTRDPEVRTTASGVCRSRIRDMFNILPPYMDY